jgi:hypothetical protein
LENGLCALHQNFVRVVLPATAHSVMAAQNSDADANVRTQTCSNPACELPGTLRCVTCIAKFVVRYCSVECQRADWKEHKVAHDLVLPEMELRDIAGKWMQVYLSAWPDLAACDAHAQKDLADYTAGKKDADGKKYEAHQMTWERWEGFKSTIMLNGAFNLRDALCTCAFCVSGHLDAPRTAVWRRIEALGDEWMVEQAKIVDQFPSRVLDVSGDIPKSISGDAQNTKKYRKLFTRMQRELAAIRKCIRALGGKYEAHDVTLTATQEVMKVLLLRLQSPSPEFQNVFAAVQAAELACEIEDAATAREMAQQYGKMQLEGSGEQ